MEIVPDYTSSEAAADTTDYLTGLWGVFSHVTFFFPVRLLQALCSWHLGLLTLVTVV